MMQRFPSNFQGRKGFSLLEILVVLAIISIILALITPGLYQAIKTRSEGAAIASLQGTLKWARNRAIAGNCWVWVGMKPNSENDGIVLFTLSSRDGSGNPKSSDEMIPLGNPALLESVSMGNIDSFPSAARPTADRVMPEAGGWIVFSPDGEARFAENPDLDPPPPPGPSLLRWIEVGLKRPNSNKPGIAAQIAGLTGQVNVYEPQP